MVAFVWVCVRVSLMAPVLKTSSKRRGPAGGRHKSGARGAGGQSTASLSSVGVHCPPPQPYSSPWPCKTGRRLFFSSLCREVIFPGSLGKHFEELEELAGFVEVPLCYRLSSPVGDDADGEDRLTAQLARLR